MSIKIAKVTAKICYRGLQPITFCGQPLSVFTREEVEMICAIIHHQGEQRHAALTGGRAKIGKQSVLIEDVHKYLLYKGWAADIAEQAADIYHAHKPNWKRAIKLSALTQLDDEEYDYTGELCDNIEQWMKDVGECPQ